MRVFRIVPFLLAFTAIAFSQTDPISEDRQKLQGTWKVTRMRSGGVERSTSGAYVVFKDATMSLTRAGQSRSLGLVYALRPSTTPREIDFFPAPEPGKQTPSLPGLYEFTTTGMKLCVAQGDPSGLKRPVRFESEKGDTHLLLILEREKEK